MRTRCQIQSLWVAATILLALASHAYAGTRMRGELGSRLQRTRISTGSNTTCLILDDATVRCWGANDKGQVGNGAFTTKVSPPAQATGVFGVIEIASGLKHTCVLLAFPGTVKCWGDNSFGQLGNGVSGGSSATAINVSSLDKVVALSAGDNFTCALRVDGTGRCWGFGSNGELGDGLRRNSSTPVSVSGLANAVRISSGTSHTCALLADGSVRCWGRGGNGQLGTGAASDEPTAIAIGLNGVADITAGAFYTCALMADGTGKCWGQNANGQLGDGTTTSRNVPTNISQLTQAIAIDAGTAHTCARRSDGTVRCWGANASGQLGDGTNTQRLDAGTAVVGLSNAVVVATGTSHSCAVDATGFVKCWGANSLGQLGNGSADSSTVPVTVLGIAGSVAARGIVVGGGLTCARRGNGTAACWGNDSNGQLGDGVPSQNFPNPIAVAGETLVAMLAAGDSHACMLRASNGLVLCWGRNNVGQLGVGNFTNRTGPSTTQLAGAIAVAAGMEHTCALLDDGSVRCWGQNIFDQLGDNTGVNSSVPVSVAGLTNAVAIAAGGHHNCALLVDGTVRCWGNNGSGQLGIGTFGSRSGTPVTVIGLNNVVALAAGANHTCAMVAGGGVRCWGANAGGQLGNGTLQNRNTPDIVTGLSDAVAVSAGSSYTCVVRAGSAADCWGLNSSGQLAAKDSANYTTPTGVINSFPRGIPLRLGHIVAIATSLASDSSAHTCALLDSGTPKCWGDNLQGQIGDGTLTDRPRPTTVPSFSANVKPEVITKSNGRIAEVTVLLNCGPGSHGQVFVSLTQGSVVGYGVASTNCGYGLMEIPIIVPAHGPAGFQPGGATAKLEAIVREQGKIMDHLFWTRAVMLAAP